MDHHFTKMAIGFETPGTSRNHPPEIDPTERSPDTLSYMFNPDITRVPFMNDHVTNPNPLTTLQNNEGNSESKSNAAEDDKTNELPK